MVRGGQGACGLRGRKLGRFADRRDKNRGTPSPSALRKAKLSFFSVYGDVGVGRSCGLTWGRRDSEEEEVPNAEREGCEGVGGACGLRSSKPKRFKVERIILPRCSRIGTLHPLQFCKDMPQMLTVFTSFSSFLERLICRNRERSFCYNFL